MCSVRISSILRSRTSIFIYLITMSQKNLNSLSLHWNTYHLSFENSNANSKFFVTYCSPSQKLIERYLRQTCLLTWFDLFHKDSQTATDSGWWLGVKMLLLGPFYTASVSREISRAFPSKPCSVVIRVVKFSSGEYKIRKKNQHAQRKWLSFENWCSWEVSKNAKIWLSNFVPPAWKLDNPYYYTLQ